MPTVIKSAKIGAMQKTSLFTLIVLIGFLAGGFVWWQGSREEPMASPFSQTDIAKDEKDRFLDKYAFTELSQRQPGASELKIEQQLKDEDDFTSFLFSFESDGRKITGLFNRPKQSPNLETEEATAPADLLSFEATKTGTGLKEGKFPVVIMIRGYVDPAEYETGMGTSRAGEYFAQNGFITLAPDFLGYGGSDDPPDNVWEERFLRPVAVIDLMASVSSLPDVDSSQLFLWGHSNGGMVALSVLALTGEKYPTTLWAPVSQFFPYDILFYTYEYEDKGRALRAALAEFEQDYDTGKYSFDNYLEWIKAPLQVHQGTADDYIPLNWSNILVERLKQQKNDVLYYTYTGADHNMAGVWNRVVARDLDFFLSFL